MSSRASSISCCSRPVPRHWIVSRSLLVMTIGTGILSGAMYATTWAGLWWLAPPGTEWPDPRTAFSLSAHVTLIALCFGSVALAASGWTRRRSAAMGAVAVMAIATYLVELLEAIWAPARDVARVSPFHYLNASGILDRHGAGVRGILPCSATIFALRRTALAYWRYQRRDL